MHLLAAVAEHNHAFSQAMLIFQLNIYFVRFQPRVNRHPKIDPPWMRFSEACVPHANGGCTVCRPEWWPNRPRFIYDERGGLPLMQLFL